MKTEVRLSTIVILLVFVYTLIMANNALLNKEFSFDRVANEGYVAFIVNEYEESVDVPDDVVNKCDCNGTKKLTHGDGHQTPCPCMSTPEGCKCASNLAGSELPQIGCGCGDQCKCEKCECKNEDMAEEIVSETPEETISNEVEKEDLLNNEKEIAEIDKFIEEELKRALAAEPKIKKDLEEYKKKDEIYEERVGDLAEAPQKIEVEEVVPNRQIIMFTASWCGPCQKFMKEEVPKLIAAGWKVGETKSCNIRIIDIDKYPTMYEKWRGYFGPGVPLFMKGQNKQILGIKTGFQTALTIGLWHNE